MSLDSEPTRRSIIAGIAGNALGLSAARGAPADNFYRGKTLTFIVGFAPGGGVDGAARVLARHLVRFIPGEPKTNVQNLEGAAGVLAANYLAGGGAPDGLTIAVPG